MAGRECPTHLLELGTRGHLLGVDRGLDAVEEALEPAHELGLRDPQLSLGRRALLGERQRQPLELLDQLGGETGLELLDRGGMDVLEAVAAGLVEGRGLHLLEELADHAADPHDLRRLLDQLGDVALALAVLVVTVARGLRHRRQRARRDGADGLAVGTDDHDLVLDLPLAAGAAGGLGLLLVGHVTTLAGADEVGRGVGREVEQARERACELGTARRNPLRCLETPNAAAQRVRTIFPERPPSSISWWARATSSSGRVASTMGRTCPEATR